METASMLHFLTELRANNTLDWMHAHKAEHKRAAADFETLVEELLLRLGKYDSTLLTLRAGDLTSRLNRDTRFSADKSPYTPAFRAHLSTGGKAPVPVGCFLMLTPGGSFLGGGLFASVFTDATQRIRDYTALHGAELAAIADKLHANGIEICGDKLKKVPRGYDVSHPQAEYLKHKSWYLEDRLEDSTVRDTSRFLDLAEARFLLMKPLNDYLNRALDGWQLPQRP